jgi:hypothetical protein
MIKHSSLKYAILVDGDKHTSLLPHHYTEHNDTENNGTQHIDIHHNDIA